MRAFKILQERIAGRGRYWVLVFGLLCSAGCKWNGSAWLEVEVDGVDDFQCGEFPGAVADGYSLSLLPLHTMCVRVPWGAAVCLEVGCMRK